MNSEDNFLQNLYDAFNRRDIETVLAMMADDVKWANGMEGGFINGRDNVRDYWRRQFEMFSPHLGILESATEDNKSVVKLRQIVRDLDGNLLDDKTVEHIFTFDENGLIKLFEIGNFTKPWMENENFQKSEN
jgi:nuclear transport factor 2 (NTF2) superfamily protein